MDWTITLRALWRLRAAVVAYLEAPMGDGVDDARRELEKAEAAYLISWRHLSPAGAARASSRIAERLGAPAPARSAWVGPAFPDPAMTGGDALLVIDAVLAHAQQRAAAQQRRIEKMKEGLH